MMADAEDYNEIKQYLLGNLTEEDQRRVEERLLIEDSFLEELLLEEDELIDQYMDGDLSEDDRLKFEQHFLSTTERHRKLKFALSLRRYVTTKAEGTSVAPFKTRLPPAWQRPLSSPYLRIAASLLILFGLIFGFWRFFIYRSDLEKGLMALNTAYRQQRPLEARISGLDYAPLRETRGGEKSLVDTTSRDRAERILLDAVHENPGPASHHALGRLYLAEERFEPAIDQFEQALKADPNNAQLHSDLGAALLELGKNDRLKGESSRSIEEFARSLEHLNKALELNPSLLEALFNRALCLQNMMLPGQAREAWSKYLERDASSSWADEARRYLKTLEDQNRSAKSPNQVLQDFLDAYYSNDDGRAWQILSQNREAITGRLVPRQLASTFLDLSVEGQKDEAGNILRAFYYAGGLEAKHAGDPYFSQVVGFYASLSEGQMMDLARAQSIINRSYELCLAGKFGEALVQFGAAKNLFEKAGDRWETYFVDYWIGYCYYRTDRLQESLKILSSMTKFCEDSGYKWLLAQTLSLTANVQSSLNEYSKALEYNNRSLKISEEIADTYSIQKSLSQIANEYRYLGGFHQALRYMQRSLTLTGSQYLSPRQAWRNYEVVAQTFYALGLYTASAAYAHEALRLGLEELKDPAVIYITYLHLGLIYGRLHDYPQAMRLAASGLQIARALDSSNSGMSMVANSTLHTANLERYGGDFNQALVTYDRAIEMYDRLAAEDQKYEAYKGRLLCHLALGNGDDVEKDLAVVLNLFEKYRSKILEEQNRDSFFDAEQSVYDLAIDYKYTSARDPQQAFQYSEDSRARSLLDSIKLGAHASASSAEPDVAFSSVSKPLDLASIRERLPDGVQIVQYAVLENKLIIWLVSRTRFEAVEREVPSSSLEAKILHFVESVSSGSEDRGEEARLEAIELYEMLISPVESLLDPDKEICIVPDKALNYLPFAALVSPATGNYLIKDHALLFSPSSNVFILCSDTARNKAYVTSERLLSVGNPSFDHKEYPSFPDLPSAEREAQTIANLYEQRNSLVGPEALKRKIIPEMARADVIHFAVHYVVDERSPLLSRLLLARETDGSGAADESVLRSSEVFGARLGRARLIVLSACSTAVERNFNGEGMVGMSRTFIAAGVPLVVASQWAVDSEATAELMIKLHEYRKLKGLSTTEALRSAQLDMLKSPEMRLRKPYYWAAFLPIGGYSSF